MDAHGFEFGDGSLDFVFGVAIFASPRLRALREIPRVLRRIVVVERLQRNPVAGLMRSLTPNARTPDRFLLGRLELRLMGVTLRSTTNSELLAVLGAIIAKRSLRARSTLSPGLVTSPTNWSCGSCKVPPSILARSSFAAPRKRELGPGEAALSRFSPNRPLSERARVGRRQRVVRRIDALNAQIRRRCQVVRLAVKLRMCE